MTQSAVDDPLAQARTAVARSAWTEAYELFSALDAAVGLEPDDLANLARACQWTGHMEECLETFARAYARHVDLGNTRKAAIVALELTRWHRHKLAGAVAMGWLRRAERLLAEDSDCVEYGYLELRRAHDALASGDAERAAALAETAQEYGRRYGDRDLELMGLHDHGLALVAQGQVDEGFAAIDEAAAAAVGGETGPFATAVVYCNTIGACRDVADYRRAGDWTEAAKRWCDRQTINGFPGMCRVYRAEVMRLRGDWITAQEDAKLACVELREWSPAVAGAAFYELGEIRLRTGDLEGAEQAFRQAHELDRDPVPGLALLELARGNARGGAALIDRALADAADDRFDRARLLPAKVELALVLGDVAGAEAAVAELRDIADRYDSTAIGAAAASGAGAVALAKGETGEAIRSLRAALQAWRLADVPYEGARTRVLLAQAYLRDGDRGAAQLELDSAKAAFERLGATPDVRRIAELQSGGAGEEAHRSFLFTDIVDSTTLAGALGDEAWTGLLGWHDRTLRDLFETHGGEEVDHTGDGFFVTFDGPAAALACAIAIQKRLAEHRQTHGFAPGVRIGVHAADARRVGDNYRGRGVHEAARIGALAGAGEILASAETAAEAKVPHSAPRTVELKGVSEPVEVVTIDWRGAG
jgi:class 3 adenylate cyclase